MISFYIFLQNFAFIFLLYYIYFTISDENDICTWSIKRKYLKRNNEDDYKAKLIFSFLKKANLRYILLDGSLLGAYRNGGFIPGDLDFDIAIPVWLNSFIFNCKDKIKIDVLEYGYNCVRFPRYYKVCNKTKSYYYKIFCDYIKSYVKNIRYSFDSSHNVFKLHFKNFSVDLWMMIGDESTYRVNKICKCLFSGIYTYGLEDASSSLIAMYGFDFFKPVSGESYNYKRKYYLPYNYSLVRY